MTTDIDPFSEWEVFLADVSLARLHRVSLERASQAFGFPYSQDEYAMFTAIINARKWDKWRQFITAMWTDTPPESGKDDHTGNAETRILRRNFLYYQKRAAKLAERKVTLQRAAIRCAPEAERLFALKAEIDSLSSSILRAMDSGVKSARPGKRLPLPLRELADADEILRLSWLVWRDKNEEDVRDFVNIYGVREFATANPGSLNRTLLARMLFDRETMPLSEIRKSIVLLDAENSLENDRLCAIAGPCYPAWMRHDLLKRYCVAAVRRLVRADESADGLISILLRKADGHWRFETAGCYAAVYYTARGNSEAVDKVAPYGSVTVTPADLQMIDLPGMREFVTEGQRFKLRLAVFNQWQHRIKRAIDRADFDSAAILARQCETELVHAKWPLSHTILTDSANGQYLSALEAAEDTDPVTQTEIVARLIASGTDVPESLIRLTQTRAVSASRVLSPVARAVFHGGSGVVGMFDAFCVLTQ